MLLLHYEQNRTKTAHFFLSENRFSYNISFVTKIFIIRIYYYILAYEIFKKFWIGLFWTIEDLKLLHVLVNLDLFEYFILPICRHQLVQYYLILISVQCSNKFCNFINPTFNIQIIQNTNPLRNFHNLNWTSL